MRLSTVQREVRRIERSVDDEAQHAAEDYLYRKVLETIAAGVTADEAAALAKAALVTQTFAFSWWYA